MTGIGHQFTEKPRRFSAGAIELRFALAKCDFDIADPFEAEVFRAIHEQIKKIENAAIALEDEYKDRA